MKFADSTITATFITEALNHSGWAIDDELGVDDYFKTVIFSGAKVLASRRGKKDVALEFVGGEKEKDFIGAMIVRYIKPEKDEAAENPGSWALDFSFDPEDLKDIEEDHIIYSTDELYKQNMYKYGLENWNVIIFDQNTIPKGAALVWRALKVFAAETGKSMNDGETIEVELDNICTFVVSKEKDEVLLSVTPDENLKRIIKNDAALAVDKDKSK